jgi:predicted phosphohydrolase
MVKNLVWVSDIHLDHACNLALTDNMTNEQIRKISENRIGEFCNKINEYNPDYVLITGDISTALFLEVHLELLRKFLKKESLLTFVLGNHDFYFGSIRDVRNNVSNMKIDIKYLSNTGAIQLTEKTSLIGHDSWYDGGYGNWFKANLIMTEYYVTFDFKSRSANSIFEKINELSKESANYIFEQGMSVCKTNKNIKNLIIASHVPPFRNNSRAPNGSISDEKWLPSMSSKKLGDAILKLSEHNKNVQILSLSGHTHTAHKEKYKENLTCMTAQSDHKYLMPELSIKLLEIE